MKSPLDRTKVVLRHLPPTITQSMLMEQVDTRFGKRYNWVSFRPGNSSRNRQVCARAYINFNRPEDVIEFAEFFDGHVFVNEKGTQFKVIVEYAPSQRVPKQWSKKDGREGTILKDPEYLEFLEILAKPIENLPSAEIQLERREAERAGAAKDAPIVTPLMDFIRQKRSAKSGTRRQVVNGKTTRRISGASAVSPSSSKRLSEKRRTSTMYVPRENSKGTSSRDKSTYVEVSRRDGQQLSDITVVSGASGADLTGNKKILLLKGKEKEISDASDALSKPQTTIARKSSPNSNAKQHERREPNGRIIKSILLNKDNRKQNEHQSQIDRDKRPPRPSSVQMFPDDPKKPSEDGIVGTDAHHIERQEKRTRNRDRPDRGVWAPLRRSDGSHASDESLSASGSQPNQGLDYIEDTRGESTNGRNGEFRILGSGRTVDNGSYKPSGRRGSVQNLKDAEASTADGKPPKRGGSSGYSSNEKQVWIQKSSSGS